MSPAACCFHFSPPRKVRRPKPIWFWGVPPASGPLLTLAEGELLMMAVSTPMAWTAMASELPLKTCGDTGALGLLCHGVGGTKPTTPGALITGWSHTVPAGGHPRPVAVRGPCPGLHPPHASCRGRAVGHGVAISPQERGKGFCRVPPRNGCCLEAGGVRAEVRVPDPGVTRGDPTAVPCCSGGAG